MATDLEEYNFPVYATQGGGYVRQVGNRFIFVEPPDDSTLTVGSDMPTEWDFQPANELARKEVLEEEFGDI